MAKITEYYNFIHDIPVLYALVLAVVIPFLIIAVGYFINLIATMIAVLAAVVVYFAVLIKSGGATEDDIKRFPKGASIARLLKKIKLL